MDSLTITQATEARELHLLSQFLLKQPQFYPNFDNWVFNKCIPHIQKNNYQAIIAINANNEIIGDAIYEFLSEDKIKIKNFRIDPLFRNRDLGHFLLTQISYHTKESKIILDVTSDNFAAVEFFIRNNFHIIRKANLYLPHQDEFIMTREKQYA